MENDKRQHSTNVQATKNTNKYIRNNILISSAINTLLLYLFHDPIMVKYLRNVHFDFNFRPLTFNVSHGRINFIVEFLCRRYVKKKHFMEIWQPFILLPICFFKINMYITRIRIAKKKPNISVKKITTK